MGIASSIELEFGSHHPPLPGGISRAEKRIFPFITLKNATIAVIGYGALAKW